MTHLDRRQFIGGLTSAMAVLSAGGCGRVDPRGLSPALIGIFGVDPAWDQLASEWIKQSTTSGEDRLLALARKLGWRPAMDTRALVAAILREARSDFEAGRLAGPDDWGLAETELQIYAVLADAQEGQAGSETDGEPR